MGNMNLIESLLSSLLKSESLLNTYKDFNDILDEEVKKLNNTKKNVSKSNKRREYSFEYKEPLTPEEKKKIVITKLNKYTDIMKLDDNNDCEMYINFKFGDDEKFYFDWDKDIKMFVTTDPNGDQFAYDSKDEQLARLTEAKEKEEKKTQVSSEQKDNTADDNESDDNCDYAVERKMGFDLKDDKNLAFNLKNALKKYHDDNIECDVIFCPHDAADKFKKEIIDDEVYDVEFDENENPVQILFPIDWFLPEFKDIDEFEKALTEIYHTESQNLDTFCELIKEKYNFSLGSWNVTFKDETKNDVKNIDFIFTF